MKRLTATHLVIICEYLSAHSELYSVLVGLVFAQILHLNIFEDNNNNNSGDNIYWLLLLHCTSWTGKIKTIVKMTHFKNIDEI